MRPHGVVGEIGRHALLAVEAQAVDELEAHVLRQQRPNRVEVLRIEALDIGLEPRPLRLGQGRNRGIVVLRGEDAQAGAPALQRRLGRRHAAADDLADLLQGMAEHVAQDYAAALCRTQPHEGPEACRRDLAILDLVPRGRDHLGILVCMPGLLARAPPQEVQGRVVGDAKQPALRVGDRPGCRRRLHRLQHGFLHHVLAVDDRAGHPCAVAMQPRPELAQELLHGLLRRRWWGGITWSFRHGRSFQRWCRHYASPPGRDRSAGPADGTSRALLRATARNRPAAAPANESIAATPMAATKPWLNASGVAWLPAWANAATASATPQAPPSWRIVLSVPEALPMSASATAPTTAFCATVTATAKPPPARTIGATIAA